ncbi:MAG: hypothetical protein JWQ11_4774 [Rhizobacter sp.]|nr:hypothetical protein [Rhizobacter sp.]
MERWNLEPLRADARRLFRHSQLQRFERALNSVVDRAFNVGYHSHEAMKIMSAALDGWDTERVFLDAMLGADEDSFEKVHSERRKAQAHAIAFMQNLHAVGDTLAHLVYFGLGLDLLPSKPLKPKQVNLETVIEALPNGHIPATGLASQLKRMAGHPEYRYVADAVNRSKHISVVGTPIRVQTPVNGTASHDITFESFQHHDGPCYPARSVTDFIATELPRRQSELDSIGRQFNEDMRSLVLRRGGAAFNPADPKRSR